MNPESEPLVIVLFIIAIAFFAILLLVALIKKLSEFSQELNSLNTEIGRTEGEEREYWKHKKRRLWLSLLPLRRK